MWSARSMTGRTRIVVSRACSHSRICAVVIGQRPEKPEKPEPLDMTFEWARDYDPDSYGLIIRLPRNTNWPIRLYMNSRPGFTR